MRSRPWGSRANRMGRKPTSPLLSPLFSAITLSWNKDVFDILDRTTSYVPIGSFGHLMFHLLFSWKILFLRKFGATHFCIVSNGQRILLIKTLHFIRADDQRKSVGSVVFIKTEIDFLERKNSNRFRDQCVAVNVRIQERSNEKLLRWKEPDRGRLFMYMSQEEDEFQSGDWRPCWQTQSPTGYYRPISKICSSGLNRRLISFRCIPEGLQERARHVSNKVGDTPIELGTVFESAFRETASGTDCSNTELSSNWEVWGSASIASNPVRGRLSID